MFENDIISALFIPLLGGIANSEEPKAILYIRPNLDFSEKLSEQPNIASNEVTSMCVCEKNEEANVPASRLQTLNTKCVIDKYIPLRHTTVFNA